MPPPLRSRHTVEFLRRRPHAIVSVSGSASSEGLPESPPDDRLADGRRRLRHAGDFASSGGAVNALALVAAHPGLVRTLVAHEPPASVLPDATDALAAWRAVHDTYHRHGFGHGMAQFIALVSLRGPVPADFASQLAPDPATFGMPTEDDGARDDLMLGANIVSVTHPRPDVDALRAVSTRIVLAVGVGSEGEFAHRGAKAVAELLGTSPVTFPGDHGGFLGGEYGQTGEPDAFAARLRDVLAEGS